MTAQIPDRFKYRGKDYSLAEQRGTGLFNPKAHRMKLTAPHTACWRGFVAHYEVRNDQLRLNALCLWSDQVETLPLLLYGAPLHLREGEVVDPLYGSYDGAYENCPEPVLYTGSLLLADGFISELYEHMGFHPAWKYREVQELHFRQGALVKVRDLSEDMRRLRRKRSARSAGG
jgi:hypothetical protein